MDPYSDLPQSPNRTALSLFEILQDHTRPNVLTSGDQAYEWLWRQQIFFPGKDVRRLSDAALASQLQLSRTPIRKALERLAQEGLIQFNPRRGYCTQVFTAKDIEEIYDVWEVNELLALRLAIPNLKTDDLQNQLNNIHSIQDSLPDVDLNLFIEADFRLHNLIIKSSGNTRLSRFLVNLLSQLVLLHIRGIWCPKSSEIALEDQKQFLMALMEGKSSQANSLLSTLINNFKISVLAELPKKAALSG